MDVEVRPVTLDDLVEVVHLRQRVADEEIWISPSTAADKPRLLARLASRLADEDAAQFVAVGPGAGGEIVGFLSVEGRGAAELGMFVAEGHRGAGIGRALLQACVDWATAAPKVHKLTLQAWPHNERAIRLYRSFGFEVEGRLRRQYRRLDQLWDALVMGLVLEAEAEGSPHPDAPGLPA